MVIIGSPHFHDQWREEGEIQRERQERRQVADRGDSGWSQETALYEVSKWFMHVSGLQISSRMCIPQSRWHGVRTSTSSDAARINTTLTFDFRSAFCQRLPSRMMKTIQFQIFHHQLVVPQGKQPSTSTLHAAIVSSFEARGFTIPGHFTSFSFTTTRQDTTAGAISLT